MKKHLFFAVLVAVIFYSTSLYAGQDHLGHFYVGATDIYDCTERVFPAIH